MKAPIPYELRGKRIWVAGHRGLVGSALMRRLAREDCTILTATREELDLMDQAAVQAWVRAARPDAAIMAAARVGGIVANDSAPADFIYDNLVIETNVVGALHRYGVEKFLFLGSSCVYPKFAEQPIHEDSLLSGALEPTNEWYAVAKIAGIKLCQAFRRQHGADFISAMPTNLYGPGDNFDLQLSHVVPALIRKAHAAKVAGDAAMTIWGTGAPRREFLHVDDCADALVHLLRFYSDEAQINVGSGEDIAIYDLARLIGEVVGFQGEIARDTAKPDGTPRKLLSAERMLGLGWRPKIALREGLAETYAWYLAHVAPNEA
ncbi:MAG: GDP-L-fucose synthase family protein [Hyphomonadaceae bacterium]